MNRKIGVLGTGDVGRTLAAGLARIGHSVMIGTRDPAAAPINEWQRGEATSVAVGSFSDAAAHGDVLILAIGWQNVATVIDLAGPDNFKGKLLLDATNPLRFETEGEPPVLVIGHTDSAGEVVQRTLPDAHVVKAFNAVGSPYMVNPGFPDGEPTMFICGNSDDAKQLAGEIIGSLGWPEPIDLGAIEHARHLEAMAMVWIVHFFNSGFQSAHAFKLLRK